MKPTLSPVTELPSALKNMEAIQSRMQGRKPIFFLDYDGTLTPIVSEPYKAILSKEMKKLLQNISKNYTLSIISGRDLRDVKSLVGIDNLYYAGSHGFDLEGPGGVKNVPGKAEELLPAFEVASKLLKEKLNDIPGILIERKKFAIAVHYRNVEDKYIQRMKNEVAEVISRLKGLKITGGKKIVEVKPDIPWHKGKVIEWLINKMEVSDEAIAIYLGDDITDEDAFELMASIGGIGILVGDHGQDTSAQYRLEDVEEVRIFLETML